MAEDGTRSAKESEAKAARGFTAVRGRVLYYLDPAGVGGAVQYIERLVPYVAAAGYDVLVMCPDHEWLGPFAATVERYGAHVVRYRAPNDVGACLYSAVTRGNSRIREAIRCLGPVRGAGKSALATLRFADDRRQLQVVERLLADWAPMILHVNLDRFPDHTGRLALLAGRRVGAHRVIATLHIDPEPPVAPRWLRHYYDRLALQAVDRLIVLADRWVGELEEWYGIPRMLVQRIPNGIPAGWFEAPPGRTRRSDLGLSDDACVVLHVGSVVPRRGQMILLESLALVLDSCPNISALFAGGAFNESYAREFRAALAGVDQRRVRWLGHRDDVHDLLALAEVLVVASLQEGHSFALLEGMATGKAIVATDVGANAESIEHEVSGIIVPPGDRRALADALARLCHDRALRRRLGDAARARAQRYYAEELMVRRTLSAYVEPAEQRAR